MWRGGAEGRVAGGSGAEGASPPGRVLRPSQAQDPTTNSGALGEAGRTVGGCVTLAATGEAAAVACHECWFLHG